MVQNICRWVNDTHRSFIGNRIIESQSRGTLLKTHLDIIQIESDSSRLCGLDDCRAADSGPYLSVLLTVGDIKFIVIEVNPSANQIVA